MADAPTEPLRRRGMGGTIARVLSVALVAVLLGAALLYGVVRWLDTDLGRAFVVRQLPLYAPQSGLTVRAGRIDGSIFGQTTIHDVSIGDPKGEFARIPRLDLDWRPLDLIDNLLTAKAVHAPEVRIFRRPALRPSADKRILPDIDIAIGSLKIDRLVLDPPVSGALRIIGVDGAADIRKGRALVNLNAVALGGNGGDVVRIKLDSVPDNDKFDIKADVSAPRGGTIDGLLGLQAPLTLTVAGDGSWTIWRGALTARLNGAPLADIALTAEKGRFTLKGEAQPSRLLPGAGARLTGPVLNIAGTATVADRVMATNVSVASKALTLGARGDIDFGREVLRGVAINAVLREPSALHPKISGRDVRLTGTLAGTFKAPLLTYRLQATSAAWGNTTASNLVATGAVAAGSRPVTVQVNATASAISGVGETAGELLHNVRLTGPLTIANGRLVSNALTVRTDRLSGTGTMVATIGEDAFLVTAKLQLPRYTIGTLGAGDVAADIRVMPGAGGTRVVGTTTVKLTRLDNAFFRRILDGLPVATANIDVANDLSLAFSNLRIASPGLTLTATGTRATDGTVRATGQGVSRDYGPVQLSLAGQIEAPDVDLVLANPGFGVGLAQVRGHVAPAPGGWRFDAKGESSYGPAAAAGLIRTAADPLAIDIASLTFAGQGGRGSLVQTATGPFAGRIDFGGKGLDGRIMLAAAGAVQRADIAINANNAVLPGVTPVSIGTGQVALTILLPDGGTTASGQFSARNVDRDAVHFDTAQGKIAFRDGSGRADFAVKGATTVPFALTGSADVAPDRIALKASGTLAGKPISLSPAAVFTRDADTWRLAPVTLQTAEGQAEISGQYGKVNVVKAQLKGIGLSLLAGFVPGFDVAGRVTGQIDMTQPRGGLPDGTATLRLNGLTRAGIASASTPIDLGLNVRFASGGGEARAVIVRGGAVEGRIQARLGPIPNGPDLKTRLLASPVFAQARYNGPAQAIWGLGGLEALDVRGPVTIAADVGGKVGDPTLAGTITARGARVEVPALGAVVTNAGLDARFTASRLELTQFSGNAGKGGTIAGSGTIGLSAAEGFPMNIRADLKNAALLNRDDLIATATGPVRIATDAYGGVVSGQLVIDKATFRIGRASAADVAVLDVTEKNAQVLGRRAVVYAKPTRWVMNIGAKADRRLFVSGLGLEAEWRGDLTIKGGVTTPEIFGRVQVVRGDYEFAGKRFALSRGDIRFQGGYPPDPVVDILAENASSALTAQLAITGTAQRPAIKFSSTPSLPEDEVLSRVLFGDSVTNLSAPEALQLAAAVNGLRGGGFNPVNAIRKGLGIDRLRILSADPTIGRKTAVAAGQYIGRNVYVELATDAQGYSATNIEVTLTRSLSILSQVATLGGTSVSLKWKRDY